MQTYLDQAEDAKPEVKDLLLKIAEDEKIHAKIVQDIINKVELKKW